MEESGLKEISTDEVIDIGVIVGRFINNVENLRGFTRNLAPFAKAYDEKAEEVRAGVTSILRTSLQTLPGHGNVIEVDKKKAEESVRDILAFIKASVPTRYLNRNQTDMLYRTSLVMLIGYFDYLMSDILRYYYITFPGALSGKDLFITLNDLNRCGDKSEAVDYILSKKVDSVLYGNLDKQLNFFSGELKIGLNKRIVKWALIDEAVERRNLIVHNNGIVNRRYISNVKRLAKDTKEGDVLSVDGQYLKNVFEEVFLAGIVLAENCWRKWGKQEAERADDVLVLEAGKAIVLEDWYLAESLCLYARGIPPSNELDIETIEIYYCHTLKKLGKRGKMEATLRKLRQKELTPLSLAMVCALVDDKDGFYKCVEDLAELGKPGRESFVDHWDWPTLADMRKDEDYQERIEQAYAKVEDVKNG